MDGRPHGQWGIVVIGPATVASPRVSMDGRALVRSETARPRHLERPAEVWADGCPLPTVQASCDHGFVSWPLHLGLTTDRWRSDALHARIPKATAAP